MAGMCVFIGLRMYWLVNKSVFQPKSREAVTSRPFFDEGIDPTKTNIRLFLHHIQSESLFSIAHSCWDMHSTLSIHIVEALLTWREVV